MMDDDALDRLLSGDVGELVGLPKRVVRLFISSTFTDMVNERNSLMERVYPRLKKYCRERYGLDFQVVDMRWGVRDEATDDHQTANLCSREIENCQRMSLGPNFVALLGDKYGFRPLCNKIKSTEYRAIRRSLIELDIGTDILDNWYREDTNAVPAEYLLQPISSILKNFTNRNEPELQSADQSVWFSIQERLHELLLIGSSRLVAQGRMSEKDRLMKYSISVTEREIIEGCLDVGEAKQSCLVYVRSIVDLRDHLAKYVALLSEKGEGEEEEGTRSVDVDEQPLEPVTQAPPRDGCSVEQVKSRKTVANERRASKRLAQQKRQLIAKYIDLTSKKEPCELDEGAQEALGKLKEFKIECKMGESKRNLMKYEIRWNEEEGISVECDEHKSYLAELTEHFYRSTTRMIRKAARNEQHFKSELTGEVLQHSHYAKHVSKSFHGRSNEIEHIRHYILGGSCCSLLHQATGPRLPMFVYGVSGSGKTSVLARVATLAKDWIQGASSQVNQQSATGSPLGAPSEDRWDHKPCIIMRFSGATPMSSSIVGVLTSVCRQLQYNFYQFALFSGSTSSKCQQQQQVSNGSQQLPFEPVEEDFVHLVFRFRQLLHNCNHPLHRNRLFVIILDSIDRLSSAGGTSMHVKYSWLTSLDSLPGNVRLIVSCSSLPKSADFHHLKRHFLLSYFPFRSLMKSTQLASFRDTSNTEEVSEMLDDGNEDEELSKLSTNPSDTLARIKHLLKVTAILRKSSLPHPSKPSKQTTINASLPLTNHTNSSRQQRSLSPLRSKTTLPVKASNHNNSQLDNLWATNVWIVHVRPMGVELAQVVLQRWLGEHKRQLSKQQWCIVRKSLLNCSRPIFVKLAFGEIINWKSYSVQGDSSQLTFGSALLEGLKLNELLDSGELAELISLVEHCGGRGGGGGWGVGGGGQELELKMQMLAMEQHWLNYLDNERSEEEQSLAQGSKGTKEDDKGLARYRASQSGNQPNSSICHLSSTIEAAICQLFARIELKHGHLLTKHSLSYITAARSGICENELEDILSLDDVVLDDVYQYHLPPVRRIPPLLWTRIRNDLSEFLSERDADGIVVNWHHGQFGSVASRRYLGERRQLRYIHSTMADYFLGRWADIPKPFKCASRHQALLAVARLAGAHQEEEEEFGRSLGGGSGSFKEAQIGAKARVVGASLSGFRSTGSSRSRSRSSASLRIAGAQSKADRRVPQQPLAYTNSSGTQGIQQNADQKADQSSKELGEAGKGKWNGKRYNLRKLGELPHHLRRAHRFRDLAEHVLFNYKWLFATLDALGLQSLLADFDESRQSLEALLAEVEQPFGSTSQMERLCSMISELRILNDTLRLSCSVLPADPQMLAPQLLARLLSLALQPAASSAAGCQHQSRFPYLSKLLDQCDKDGSLDCALLPIAHCLQAADGLLLSSLEGHSFSIMAMMVDINQRHLLAASDRFIMWDASTGEVSRYVDPLIQGSIILACQLSLNNQYAIGYTSEATLLALDMLTQQVSKFTFNLVNEPILGLSLINKITGTTFLVFTKSKWFVFQLVKDVVSSPTSTTNKQVVLEFLYSLTPQTLNSYTLIDVEQVSAKEKQNLTFVTLKESTRLILLSGFVEYSTNGSIFNVWSEEIEAQALCLEMLSLKQLIVANLEGQVYLRRRRRCCWSKGKCVWFGVESGKRAQIPLALEVEPSQEPVDDEMFEVSRFDEEKLALFEGQVDCLYGENEELGNEESQVFKNESNSSHYTNQYLKLKKYTEPPIKHVKIYLPEQIIVISFWLKNLDKKETRQSCLELPKGTRNTNVTANKCQTKSLILDDTFLVLALNKQLLIYSLNDSSFIKTVDAHNARIVKLLPVLNFSSETSSQQKQKPLNFASASMDKSVKIWNLANLSKEAHLVDQLDGPVHSVSVSEESSLVCCLDRSQLGLLDWQSLRMCLRTDLVNLIGDSQLMKCRLSSSGKHLCLATSHSVHLFTIEGASFSSSSSSSPSPSPYKVHLNLKSSFQLMAGSSARSIRFFLKDSRLLIVLEAMEEEQRKEHSSMAEVEEEEEGEEEEYLGEEVFGAQLRGRRRRGLVIQCRSVPEGKLLYSINTSTPIEPAQNISEQQGSHHCLSGGGSQHPVGRQRRFSFAANIRETPKRSEPVPVQRLPVLTCDQQYVVCVEPPYLSRRQEGSMNGGPRGGAGSGAIKTTRRSLSSNRQATNNCWLVVYSSRDGARLRELDLSCIEVASSSAENNNRLARVQVKDVSKFTHLKPVTYRERRTVVALMDKESGLSHFVDTHSSQLLLTVEGWSGKLSLDGKLGLSQVFKPTPASTLRPPEVGGSAIGSAPSSLTGGSIGLELLDLAAPGRGGFGSRLKSLLSQEQLANLEPQNEWSAAAATAGRGGDSAEVMCGFAGEEEEYVYYYELRLPRLLLVRLSDAQLVANYRLPAPLTKILSIRKSCALLLAFSDGSLCSLAIVDGQKPDTLARLAEYPARKKRARCDCNGAQS